MRWIGYGSMLFMVVALFLVVPTTQGAVDTIEFHKFSGEGPVAPDYNDGETVYINASDGTSVGGTVTYFVIDESGGNYSLTLRDNGGAGDNTPNDGYYTARFTIYNTTVPSGPYTKIQLDYGEDFTVITDLDGSNDWTSTVGTTGYEDFALWVTGVSESSDNIFFDNASKTLHYSSDQAMSDDFTVLLRDNKQGALGKDCSGATAFGNTPTDNDYSDRQWDMLYTIDSAEVYNGTIQFTVDDAQNNSAYYNLTVRIDDDSPFVNNLAIADLPDHLGPLFRWWEPSGLGAGLNVTWTNSDAGAGIGTGTLDWDASVDLYDQLGIACGVDGYEIVTNLDDDGSCQINITVTIEDNVGNPASDTYSIMFDATAPNVVSINVTEASSHIHFNGTLIYSNDQVMSDTFTFLVQDDEAGSGRDQAVGSNAFGDTPSDSDYSDSEWDLPYTIDMGESSGAITIFVYDNVGNWNSAVVNTMLDNEAPDLDTWMSENSSYLYVDSMNILYFGDDMPGTEAADFYGTAVDNIGLSMLVFTQEANLAGSPAATQPLNVSATKWNDSYMFDSSSTQGVDGELSIYLHDLVGNTDSFTQTYQLDDTSPTIILQNYADGDILLDNDPLISYGSPWEVDLQTDVDDDLTTLHRVDVSVDGGAWTTWFEGSEGLYNLSSAVLNGTGWHSILWRARDHVNNTRLRDSSIFRSPNGSSDPFVRALDVGTTVVDAGLQTTWGATVTTDQTSPIWGSVMRYPTNPIDPDPNRNYTTFHYLDVGVNDTTANPNMTVRIYFTQYEIGLIQMQTDGIIGIARWNGLDWHWISSSTVSIVDDLIVGGIGYVGYADVTIPQLYNSSNIVCVAGWTYRLTIVDDQCTTNRTIFRDNAEHTYRRDYDITFTNIGASSDDYWVNATGPGDWNISWEQASDDLRSTIASLDPGENLTLSLWVRIPNASANVSSGWSDTGKEYPIAVTIESFTDVNSTLNDARDDDIDLVGFIRRTDLLVSEVNTDRSAFIEGYNITVYGGIQNVGNYTTQSVNVHLYYSIDGGPDIYHDTESIWRGDLQPLETAWVKFVLAPPEGDTYEFIVNFTYGGDEIPGNPNRGTGELVVNKKANSDSSGGLPVYAPLLLAMVLSMLYNVRRRDEP